MAGLFIGFLVEKCPACQSHRKSDFGWIAFTHFPSCLMRIIKRVQKSLKRLWWPSRASWLVSLSYYCIWCVFFSGFLKSSVVSATSLCTRQWSTITYKENVAKNTMYLVMLLAVKRKLWAIFLPRGSSWSKHREAGLNLQGFRSLWAYAHDFQRHLLSKLIVVNENVVSVHVSPSYIYFTDC